METYNKLIFITLKIILKNLNQQKTNNQHVPLIISEKDGLSVVCVKRVSLRSIF